MARDWEPERERRESYPGPGDDLTVMYGDLDPNRHVNNVAMGRFFEQGRVLANSPLRADGTDAAWPRSSSFLVARVRLDYLAEAHWGTPIHVRTRVGAIGSASVTQQQAAWQGEVCVALAESVIVHRTDGGTAALPAALRAAFASRQVRDGSARG